MPTETIVVEESDEAPDRAAGIGPRPPLDAVVTRIAGGLGSKINDWFPQIEPCKSSHTGGLHDGSPQRLCRIYRRGGGWKIPCGFAACTAGDPDGTRTDGPQAAHLSDSPQYQPIVRLRSSAVRRCDDHHGMVELGHVE